MEPIPSLRIIKYVLYDQFKYKRKQQLLLNKQIHQELSSYILNYKYDYPLTQTFSETTWTIFDLETTGFFPKLGDEIVSIGAIKMNLNQMKFEEHFYETISPIGEVPEHILSLTGLTKQQIANGKPFLEVFLRFLQFSKGSVLVAHPATFDVHFLQVMAKRWGLPKFLPLYIDSYYLANYLQPKQNNKLDPLVSYFNIEQKERHHALNDAHMTAEVFKNFLTMLPERDIYRLEDLLKCKSKKGSIIST